MHFVLRMMLFFYLVKYNSASSRSHQYYRNVLSKMSTSFGRALFSCRHVVPMTQNLLMEFYHYWDTKRPLSEKFGCLAGCTALKLGLMSRQGGQEARFKGFITRHGGDALFTYRFKELLFNCAQVISKKRFKNTCHSAKEIATCLRTGIAYYHWSPTLNDIYRDMIKKKTRRVLNGSEHFFNTINNSLSINSNITTTIKNRVLNSTNYEDGKSTQMTTQVAGPNTETEVPFNDSVNFHYIKSMKYSTQYINLNNISTTESINVINSADDKTFNIIINNTKDEQSIQVTPPLDLLNTKTETGPETDRSTTVLPIQDYSKVIQTETKHSISIIFFVEINTTNVIQVDTKLLRKMLNIFEERAKARDIELIGLYKANLLLIQNHLNGLRSTKMKKKKKKRWVSARMPSNKELFYPKLYLL